MGTSNYRKLWVWQKGMEIVHHVYRLTRSFPEHEKYGISSQLQRAAVSIPANLAEGHTRETTKEYLRYVVIAHGSLAELETLLLVAHDLQFIDDNDLAELMDLCDTTGKMLASLRRKLRSKITTRQSPKSLNPQIPSP